MQSRSNVKKTTKEFEMEIEDVLGRGDASHCRFKAQRISMGETVIIEETDCDFVLRLSLLSLTTGRFLNDIEPQSEAAISSTGEKKSGKWMLDEQTMSVVHSIGPRWYHSYRVKLEPVRLGWLEWLKSGIQGERWYRLCVWNQTKDPLHEDQQSSSVIFSVPPSSRSQD